MQFVVVPQLCVVVVACLVEEEVRQAEVVVLVVPVAEPFAVVEASLDAVSFVVVASFAVVGEQLVELPELAHGTCLLDLD